MRTSIDLVQLRRAETHKPVELTVEVGRDEVEVHPVLHRLALGHLVERETWPGRRDVGCLDHRVRAVGAGGHRAAERCGPEACRHGGVGRVVGHAEHCAGHAVSPSDGYIDDQRAVLPPSTAIVAPVMNALLSEARNTMTWAISSGSPTRLSGTPAIKAALRASVPVNLVSMPVSIGPGATTLTRTPDPAASSAADWVSPSTAC